MNPSSKRELLSLVEALCEETATAGDIARLEQLVLEDSQLRRLYVEAMTLHGMLAWDAGGLGDAGDSALTLAAPSRADERVDPSQPGAAARPRVIRLRHGLRPRLSPVRRRRLREIATGLGLLVLLKLSFAFWSPAAPQMAMQPAAPVQQNQNGPVSPVRPEIPAEVPGVRLSSTQAPSVAAPHQPHPEQSAATANSGVGESDFQFTDDQAVVQRINERIHAGWATAKVTPAATASDAEWVRRTYLDLAGRIPTAAEVQAFFEEPSANKRQALVDQLLGSPEFPKQLATVWTDLLVGRARTASINRNALQTWLEEQFAESRPWRETVTQLVAARGTADANGPANFLLAHLNNQAVPATAITARIFLCEQLQCTQCHQHPVVKTWGQERFWELNAFFQQAEVRERRIVDAGSGAAQQVRELVDSDDFGPTYYETLRGVMQVAFPKFAGVEVSTDAPRLLPLREQLAQLLFADDAPQPARAFVNRTWAQLMGQGFTTPLDDMGPQTPVSHPELLEDLTVAFVQSGYDVHRLVRWICLSEPYQLASRASSRESPDAPEQGERPLFSRMYVKMLSPEQLFDSLRIASGLSPRQLLTSETRQAREAWLQQFYSAVDTEENGEASTFDGSLPQALMMMNGELVQQATSPADGHVLAEVASPHGLSEAERIRQLSLAALARYPSSDELSQLRDLLRRTVRQRVNEQNLPPQLALAEGLKDVYWAYLNSSEFAVNH